MPNDNPFNDGELFPEPTSGETFTNLTTQRRVQIGGHEFITREHSIQPRDDGTYEDTQTVHVNTDRAGNPIPEDPSKAIISHSGIFVTPETAAVCTSWLHWGQRSRTISVGHDGHLTPSGAICSNCYGWYLTLTAVAFIIGGGCLLGILIGLLDL